MKIDRQCKVKFVVTGVYIDEMLCEVVPLNICNLIFGSPYLWDRDATFFQNEEIKRQVTKLLESGAIKPSSSPYGSPIVLVPKKDGGCITRCELELKQCEIEVREHSGVSVRVGRENRTRKAMLDHGLNPAKAWMKRWLGHDRKHILGISVRFEMNRRPNERKRAKTEKS
uniref:Uncharacterized protein n=1 Tax=Ananas comosus var. bracteatus TaxID=296719 RepID=A0A6V7QVS8_ANACO